MPEDRKILKDAGLIGSLQMVVLLSQTSCSQHNQLYVRNASNGDVLLVAESRACLEKTAKSIVESGATYTNKSLYLLKQ